MINWIRCSDQMPMNDQKVIYRKIGDKRPSSWNGISMKAWLRNVTSYEWIPFTDEAWKELNK